MAYTIVENCIGCTACTKKCPVEAITGLRNEIHIIDEGLCIDCGACGAVCPPEAILDEFGDLARTFPRKELPLAHVISDNCIGSGCELCMNICPFEALSLTDSPNNNKDYFGIAEVVLAIPEEFIDIYTTLDLDEVADEFRKKNNSLIQIGTKYVNITRRFLEEKGVTNFEIIKSLGATELMPKLLKNCMCISDVSQTGSTLKSNKLRVLENGIIMKTSACLFVNKKSYKKKGINNLIRLLSK